MDLAAIQTKPAYTVQNEAAFTMTKVVNRIVQCAPET